MEMNDVLERWEEHVEELFGDERTDKPDIDGELEGLTNNERRSRESSEEDENWQRGRR